MAICWASWLSATGVYCAVHDCFHLLHQTIQVEGGWFLPRWEFHKRLELLRGQLLCGIESRKMIERHSNR